MHRIWLKVNHCFARPVEATFANVHATSCNLSNCFCRWSNLSRAFVSTQALQLSRTALTNRAIPYVACHMPSNTDSHVCTCDVAAVVHYSLKYVNKSEMTDPD